MYIYDYCNKRGFRKTARELRAEAALDLDSRPPIDAKQGLLYEYVTQVSSTPHSPSPVLVHRRWWSVFWVLFTAKNGNGNGSEDAQIYVEVGRLAHSW